MQPPDILIALQVTGRWPGVGRWRVLLTQAVVFARLPALPVNRNILAQRMDHGYRSRPGAFFYTTGAEPAFFGIKDNRRLLLFRIGHHYVSRAYLHAQITAGTNIGIEFYSFVRCWRIRYHIDFGSHLTTSLSPFNFAF
jgi:hypothetical protein